HRLDAEDHIAYDFGRNSLRQVHNAHQIALTGRHVTLTLQGDPLVGYRVGRLPPKYFAYNALPSVVGTAPRGMILAKGFHRDAEHLPAGWPIDTPGELASLRYQGCSPVSAGTDIRHGFRHGIETGNTRTSQASACRAQGIVRGPVVLLGFARLFMQNALDGLGVLQRLDNLRIKLAGAIHLMSQEDFQLHAERLHGLQKRR